MDGFSSVLQDGKERFKTNEVSTSSCCHLTKYPKIYINNLQDLLPCCIEWLLSSMKTPPSVGPG